MISYSDKRAVFLETDADGRAGRQYIRAAQCELSRQFFDDRSETQSALNEEYNRRHTEVVVDVEQGDELVYPVANGISVRRNVRVVVEEQFHRQRIGLAFNEVEERAAETWNGG